jgi:hypothetical protein
MEAERISETSVYFNESTWRYIPEVFIFELIVVLLSPSRPGVLNLVLASTTVLF